jgi:predicted metal-dependent enzyme (double-stranded beta helix superfamily)
VKTREVVSVRKCAQGLGGILAAHDGDLSGFVEEATPLVQRLLARPDLLTLGFPAGGTHRIPVRILYWDGDLTILAGHEPAHEDVPVHDHGMWEMLGLYAGSLDHRLYERLDDGSVPGYADLQLVDETRMEPGDIVCVPEPPNDVHGFTPQTHDTWLVAIVPGWYADTRRYFDPERSSYYLNARAPV